MEVHTMKLSTDSGPKSVPLLDETIPQNLARTVAEHADRDALVSVEQGIRLTYAQFADEVDQVARGLMGIGVAKGDRVGIWSPNYAEWVLVQYATARIGAILVTINPAYRSSELGVCAQPVGALGAGGGGVVLDERLPIDGRRGLGGGCRLSG